MTMCNRGVGRPKSSALPFGLALPFVLALPLTLVALPALAQTTLERVGYGHGAWEFGWGHMLFGGFMMIAFWAGIILLIVLAVRRFGNGASHPRERGLEILEERFARGEIDKAEFEDRKKSLVN